MIRTEEIVPGSQSSEIIPDHNFHRILEPLNSRHPKSIFLNSNVNNLEERSRQLNHPHNLVSNITANAVP